MEDYRSVDFSWGLHWNCLQVKKHKVGSGPNRQIEKIIGSGLQKFHNQLWAYGCRLLATLVAPIHGIIEAICLDTFKFATCYNGQFWVLSHHSLGLLLILPAFFEFCLSITTYYFNMLWKWICPKNFPNRRSESGEWECCLIPPTTGRL